MTAGGASVRAAAVVEFERAYGRPPTGVARAPGRVNLIGEHIDYCGLTVLPMALRRGVSLAFRPRDDDRVRVRTVDGEFSPAEFPATPPISPAAPGEWSNYVRAAVQGVAKPGAGGRIRGFDGCLSTDLPVAAGLSSSSALVVAAALATLTVNGDIEGDRLLLAARLAEAERYVGTAGGGMDQASSLLGKEGHAIAIDFEPLRVTPIRLPSGWRVVVGHSGQRAEKSGVEQAIYNQRTREAADAATRVSAVLKEASRLPAPDECAEATGLRLYPYLLASMSAVDLLEVGASTLRGAESKRFRHIISESARVTSAIEAARSSDASAMGALLDASHASLRDDYEVSTPELDRLVESMRAAGAAGARLTGAGMGGCAIGLCRTDDVDAVLEEARRFEAASGGPRIAFVAEAGDGASAHVLD